MYVLILLYTAQYFVFICFIVIRDNLIAIKSETVNIYDIRMPTVVHNIDERGYSFDFDGRTVAVRPTKNTLKSRDVCDIFDIRTLGQRHSKPFMTIEMTCGRTWSVITIEGMFVNIYVCI